MVKVVVKIDSIEDIDNFLREKNCIELNNVYSIVDEILDPDEKLVYNTEMNITLKILQENHDKKYKTFTINKFIEYLEERNRSRDDRVFDDMIFLVSSFIEIGPRCTFDQLIEYLKQFNGEQKIKFIENFGIYNLEIHKIDV